MKKTILTFFIFALSFSMFAQINTIEVFRVYDPNDHFYGFVNVRAGAGINHEVIERLYNHRIVLRDFDRQIVNEWIPVKYQDFPQFYNFNKGYIHQSRLVPESFEFSITLPNPTAVDARKRSALQQAVNDIRTMSLRSDTTFYLPQSELSSCVFIEIAGYDEMGRLRKFFSHKGCSDGGSHWQRITAYYSDKGELLHIVSIIGSAVDFGREAYWVSERQIVDFFLEYSFFPFEKEEPVLQFSDDHIGRDWDNVIHRYSGIKHFINLHTILEIINCENRTVRIEHWM